VSADVQKATRCICQYSVAPVQVADGLSADSANCAGIVRVAVCLQRGLSLHQIGSREAVSAFAGNRTSSWIVLLFAGLHFALILKYIVQEIAESKAANVTEPAPRLFRLQSQHDDIAILKNHKMIWKLCAASKSGMLNVIRLIVGVGMLIYRIPQRRRKRRKKNRFSPAKYLNYRANPSVTY
jgi:hypothetical protein